MKKFLSVIMAIMIISVFVVFALGSGDKTTSVSSESATQSTTQGIKKVTINPSETLTTDDLKITYSECSVYTGYNQYAAPKAGNVIIKLTFNVENSGSTDRFISAYDFKCYADDAAASDYIYGDNILSATVSPGRKASGSIYFEVPKAAANVEIEYETNYWTNNKAIFVVPEGWNK